jgi:hypothetical protein
MEKENTKFLFNFADTELKKEFKIKSVKLNKSMTELLNELVMKFLKK